MSEHHADPIELAAVFRPVEDHLVVLDFDGTLSPIVDRPGDADLERGALDALRALTRRTAVAVISGREVADLLQRLGGLDVTLAGGHGALLRDPDGSVEQLIDTAAVTETLDDVEAQIRALVDEEPGWLVERKDASLAVHHRLAAPDRVEELLPRVDALLDARRDEAPGFAVLAGKAVVELRPAGIDKGAALLRMAQRTPELTPLVIGDDVTDEDAFRAAVKLGGTSVVVSEEPRETVAQHRLLTPSDVVSFLAALASVED